MPRRRISVLGLAPSFAFALVGCGSEPTRQLGATWAIRSLDGTVQPCPDGFDSVAVVAQRLDDDGFDDGTPEAEVYPCAAGAGIVAELPAGRYEARIAVQDGAATMTYASSPARRVDLTSGDGAFDAEVLTDGGYVRLEWGFLDGRAGIPQHNPLSCTDAGIVGVRAISERDDRGGTVTDLFACEDRVGVSSGLAPGARELTVELLDADERVVKTFSGGAYITAPSGVHRAAYSVEIP